MDKEKLKRVIKNVGQTFKHIGSTGAKVLNDMEKQDKELNEKMRKAMGNVDL
jgi:hypothetical protein